MFKIIRRLSVALMFAGWAGSAAAGPITDIVTVNGRDWAQVDLFTELSWNDINAVCDASAAGVCGSGSLNGWDMEGWTWAGIAEFDALMNTYLAADGVTGTDLLSDPYFDSYSEGEAHPAWIDAILGDFRLTSAYADSSYSQYYIGGNLHDTEFVSNPFGQRQQYAYGAVSHEQSFGSHSLVHQHEIFRGTVIGLEDTQDYSLGSWFYRSDVAEVPTPVTLNLFGLALAGLALSRCKKIQSTSFVG